jgi:hypothetical protein
MKISIMKMSVALLATAVFARRNGNFRSARPLKTSDVSAKNASTPKNAITSVNWAGAILGQPRTPAPNYTWYAVGGSFAVPKPSPPTAGNTTGKEGVWSGSAWVGIDGIETPGIFQAGIEWSVAVNTNGSLEHNYTAWHEWIPSGAVAFDNFAISPGDIITVRCEANSSTSGVCAMKNQNTGMNVSTSMTTPSNASLVGSTAEWIVEDPLQDGLIVPFANFGKVEWFDCKADARVGGAAGNTTSFYPSDATPVIIDFGFNHLTNVSTSGKNITVTYLAKSKNTTAKYLANS